MHIMYLELDRGQVRQREALRHGVLHLRDIKKSKGQRWKKNREGEERGHVCTPQPDMFYDEGGTHYMYLQRLKKRGAIDTYPCFATAVTRHTQHQPTTAGRKMSNKSPHNSACVRRYVTRRHGRQAHQASTTFQRKTNRPSSGTECTRTDLQTGVELQEEEAVGLRVEQVLHGAGTAVADVLSEPLRGALHLLEHRRRHDRGGALRSIVRRVVKDEKKKHTRERRKTHAKKKHRNTAAEMRYEGMNEDIGEACAAFRRLRHTLSAHTRGIKSYTGREESASG